jgi:hypothetical protein
MPNDLTAKCPASGNRISLPTDITPITLPYMAASISKMASRRPELSLMGAIFAEGEKTVLIFFAEIQQKYPDNWHYFAFSCGALS